MVGWLCYVLPIWAVSLQLYRLDLINRISVSLDKNLYIASVNDLTLVQYLNDLYNKLRKKPKISNR